MPATTASQFDSIEDTIAAFRELLFYVCDLFVTLRAFARLAHMLQIPSHIPSAAHSSLLSPQDTMNKREEMLTNFPAQEMASSSSC